MTGAVRSSILVLTACVLALLGPVRASCAGDREISVSAEVSSQRVYVGEKFRLNLQVEGSRSPAQPRFAAPEGLEVRFLGGQDVSSSSTMIINGRRVDQKFEGYVYSFELTATQEGSIEIPAIEVEVEGARHLSQPIRITAVKPAADSDVKLWIEVDPPQAYVGEPVKLRISLGLMRDAHGVSISVPGIEGRFEVVPVEAIRRTNIFQQSQNTLEFLGDEVPTQQSTRTVDGTSMPVFTSERTIIPRQPGTLTVGPATVGAELVLQQARSFFESARTRRVVVPSESIKLEVRPLPTEGKPANFSGLIGKYEVSVRAKPTEVSVGDPIEVEIRVSGPLPDMIPPPALERQLSLSTGFRIGEESAPPIVRTDSKVFQRVFRVLAADVGEIPPIEVPYFDTASGKYEIARSRAIPLSVRAAKVVTAPDAVGASVASASAQPDASTVEDSSGGLRHNYEGPALLADQSFALSRILTSPTGIAVVAGPPAAYAALVIVGAVRRRSGRGTDRRRSRHALANARSALSAAAGAGSSQAAMGAAIRAYFTDKLGRARGGLTTAECVVIVAEHAPPDLAERLRSLLERCDAAAYGGWAVSGPPDVRLASDLLAEIDAFLRGPA